MGLMAKGTRCVTGLVCSLLGWWILYKNKTPENIVDSKGECGVCCINHVGSGKTNQKVHPVYKYNRIGDINTKPGLWVHL